MRQLCGKHFDRNIYFEGSSYNCPALMLYGYSTEMAVKRAIEKKLSGRKARPTARKEG